MSMPPLETERLSIRPYVMEDLEAIHPILNQAFGEIPLEDRGEWLAWSALNVKMLANLGQPPYGDRAIVLKSTGKVIGSVGLVPSYGPFDKLPYFSQQLKTPTQRSTPEMGMFWALGESYRGQGYATESAQAIIDFMFHSWGLKRIIATTEYDNHASIKVMERLGMSIQRNPDKEPEWFQVVGILNNPIIGNTNSTIDIK